MCISQCLDIISCEAASGAIIYLPPEAADVPGVMAGVVAWIQRAEREGLPAPLIAALAHYQFVTIHPYFDGNGRAARLLATFILHRGGYGLHGFFSLEEHHARDLAGYYGSLATHPHHNYYVGRAEAERYAGQPEDREPAEPEALRRLDHRARTVLALFAGAETITTAQVAGSLGLSERTARLLLRGYVADGWLLIADPSNRRRAYALSASYRQYIGALSAMKP